MRLPLPLLLYVLATGLFCWAGFTVYEMLPLWQKSSRDGASRRGSETSDDLLLKGRGSEAIAADWNYGGVWWKQFKGVNLLGRLPPNPKTPEELAQEAAPPEPPVNMTPLDQIIELVSLVYDGKNSGRGGKTHVIVRYKPEANVEVPEWWVRENSPPTSAAGGTVAPRDLIAQPGGNFGRTARLSSPPTTGTQAATAMPTTSLTGREILQKMWIENDGDERHSSRLWGAYENIRLVRVAPDAQVAYFVRELPASKDGEPAAEPQEEPLIRTTLNLSQDVMRELRSLQGKESPSTSNSTAVDPEGANSWRDVAETTRFGNDVHIGRNDLARFQERGPEVFDRFYVDTYVSRHSSLRGLSVRGVEPQIAQGFGVNVGDVLLEVNNRKVESKAQVVNMVKNDYQRGVRTWSTKWLSNGQVVERLIQAPNR